MKDCYTTGEYLLTYYSQQTEVIAKRLLTNLTQSRNPFTREIILVQNSGMQRYLELTIAKQLGVCTHIDITYSGSFLWQQYQHIIPDVEKTINYQKRLLTFKILPLLTDFKDGDNALAQTLKNQRSPKQHYYLATDIADYLLKYLSERPELIDMWEDDKLATQNPHEAWQREIYLKLNLSKHSRHFLQQTFQRNLPQAISKLPKQVHVFGFHALAETHLKDLLALSAVINVNFYTINPCIEFWGDIIKHSHKLKLELDAVDVASLFEVGNPLLASWGYAGKHLIDTLNEYQIELLDEDNPLDEPQTYLQLIQENIQNLHADNQFFQAQNNDNSISIHVASSPRREVEILQDYLLTLFENSNIQPSDVIVMMPQINTYSAHIQAIFGAAQGNQYLPYSIANQTAANNDADSKAFLALLQLIDQQFAVADFFAFCNQQSVRENSKLTSEEIDTIRYWLETHRVAWGYSTEYKKDIVSDPNLAQQNHLQKMLDELFLAYSTGNSEHFVEDTLPSQGFQSGQIETLDKLSKILTQLHLASQLSKTPKTLLNWHGEMKKLLASFLPDRHETSKVKHFLDKWLDELTGIADTSQTYDFAVIESDIRNLLESEELKGPFLSGGISFCATMPMRSIPTKVICMLGMNHDFPIVNPKSEFDLRHENPKLSDKDLSRESKYLFLESILAARQYLYISYVGIDEKTATNIPPAVMVSELQNYLETVTSSAPRHLKTTHPLQSFHPSLFSQQQTYNGLYQPQNFPNKRPVKKTVELSTPSNWTIKQIARLIADPLDYYLRHQLGITFPKAEDNFKSHEFITAESGLDKWLLNQTLIQHHDKENDYKKTLLAKNLLAPEPFASLQQQQAQSNISQFQQTVTPLRINKPDNLHGFLSHHQTNGNEYHLSYQLDNIGSEYQLITRFSQLNTIALIEVWLSHLILNQHGDNMGSYPNTTRFICTTNNSKGEKQVHSLILAPITDVKIHLQSIFSLIEAAHHKPLSFIPKVKITKNRVNFNFTLANSLVSKGIAEQITLNQENAERQFKEHSQLWEGIIHNCEVKGKT